MVTLLLKLALILYQHQCSGSTIKDELLVKSNTNCTCLSDTLTFECTVVGESYGITVWKGSALSSCSVHEISIRHGQFTMPRSTRRDCNNGSIVAQGLRVDNGSYISQLNVTVTSDVIGKSIECAYDNLVNITTTVGLINVSIAEYYDLYQEIAVMAKQSKEKVIIKWTRIQYDCPLHYNILASNCGSCPTTTTNTTVTCTDVPTDGSIILCEITIEAVICRRIVIRNTTEIELVNTANHEQSKGHLIIIGCTSVTSLLVFLAILGTILLLFARKRLKTQSTLKTKQWHTSLSHKTVVATEEDEYDTTIKIFDNKATGIYADVKATNYNHMHGATVRVFDNKANGIYYDVGKFDHA